MSMRIVRVVAGLFLVAGCGTEPPKPVVTSIVVSPTSPQIEVGTSVIFTAVVRDQNSNILTGQTVGWSVGDPSIASMNGIGALTGLRAGSTSITATVAGKTASTSVVVVNVPVSVVRVNGAPSSLLAGQTVALTAALTDRNGSPATGRQVAWSSSAPSIATVDQQGVVRGLTPGTVTITATSEGITGGVTFLVLPEGTVAPSVTGISPAVLQPSRTVTINGFGFDPVASRNVVTIRGERATVTQATPVQLSVVVPCVQSGPAEIRIVTNGLAGAPSTHPLEVPSRTLGVGESLILTDNVQAVCNELVSTGTARYVIAVFSGSTSASSLTDYQIAGNEPPAGVSVAQLASPSRAAGPVRESVEAQRDRKHFEFMERDRREYEALLARDRGRPRVRSLRASVPPPAVGDTRPIYYTFTGGCQDSTRVIGAKVIYVGDKSVIWEDTTNTLQSSVDPALAGYYARLGQIFDRDQYESIRRTFGDPLRRDPETDADGRVHMVFTQRLNGSGAAAYVTGCDQFPRETAFGSNFGEFFYGTVPDTPGSNVNSTRFADGWFYFMARTVVHEVKHIASVAARRAMNAPGEVGWLEEGTARHAEEVWVRESLHKVGWKANTGFGTAAHNGIYCDFHPENVECNAHDALRRPGYGMRRQFNELREKLLQPWNWSPYGDGPGQTGSVFYQTVWSLVRYAIDRYGASDAAFLSGLVNATTSGTTNLAGVAGVPIDRLIGEWSLALYLDDHPMATAATLPNIPTWNFRSIYSGLNSDPVWANRWSTPYPIQPTPLPFGSFSLTQLGLRGGAAAYYELAGTQATRQLIALRSANGGIASSLLRVAIARLQ